MMRKDRDFLANLESKNNTRKTIPYVKTSDSWFSCLTPKQLTIAFPKFL